jgi:hypothetical protein
MPTQDPAIYMAEDVKYTQYVIDVLPYIILIGKKLKGTPLSPDDCVMTARWIIDLIFYTHLHRDDDLLEISFAGVYGVYAQQHFENFHPATANEVIDLIVGDLDSFRKEIMNTLEKIIVIDGIELYGAEFIPALWSIDENVTHAKLTILI